MDINNLSQTDANFKTPKTDTEREKLAGFKSIAKYEQNFAELIKNQKTTDINYKGYYNNRLVKKIETSYDNDGNVLF